MSKKVSFPHEMSIADLAYRLATLMGFQGEIFFDQTK